MHIEKLCFNFTIFKTIYQVSLTKTKIFARTFVGTQQKDEMNIEAMVFNLALHFKKHIISTKTKKAHIQLTAVKSSAKIKKYVSSLSDICSNPEILCYSIKYQIGKICSKIRVLKNLSDLI